MFFLSVFFFHPFLLDVHIYHHLNMRMDKHETHLKQIIYFIFKNAWQAKSMLQIGGSLVAFPIQQTAIPPQFGYQNISGNREHCMKAVFLSLYHQRRVACSNPNATDTED
jgi:hypothetical protein